MTCFVAPQGWLTDSKGAKARGPPCRASHERCDLVINLQTPRSSGSRSRRRWLGVRMRGAIPENGVGSRGFVRRSPFGSRVGGKAVAHRIRIDDRSGRSGAGQKYPDTRPRGLSTRWIEISMSPAASVHKAIHIRGTREAEVRVSISTRDLIVEEGRPNPEAAFTTDH